MAVSEKHSSEYLAKLLRLHQRKVTEIQRVLQLRAKHVVADVVAHQRNAGVSDAILTKLSSWVYDQETDTLYGATCRPVTGDKTSVYADGKPHTMVTNRVKYYKLHGVWPALDVVLVDGVLTQRKRMGRPRKAL